MSKTTYIEPASTVLVTGAASGIGAATAKRLASEGFNVICCDRNEDALAAVVDAVTRDGGSALAVVGDVSEENDCKRFVEAASSQKSPLKAVVNNAGIGAFGLDMETLSREEWDRIISINLTSIFLISKYAIRHLKKTGGAIVNVASIHSFATSPGVTPYAASKGGVLTLTRAMALDLAEHSIRVVAVAPGAIDTDILVQHAERQGTTVEGLGFPPGDSAIGRVGRPEEIAGAIRYLLSADATLMTGSTIQLEAGLLAKF
jgi:NAD(P)-dependent dehydrogenase (short-subunit alcohol dehydrogenase family)